VIPNCRPARTFTRKEMPERTLRKNPGGAAALGLRNAVTSQGNARIIVLDLSRVDTCR